MRKNVGIGVGVDLPTQDPIVLRNRNNSNRKKRAAVIQRFQGNSAPVDFNFILELLSKIEKHKFTLNSCFRVF